MKAVMDAEDTTREIKSRLVVYQKRLLDLLKSEPPRSTAEAVIPNSRPRIFETTYMYPILKSISIRLIR
jgi:hypothetical protein